MDHFIFLITLGFKQSLSLSGYDTMLEYVFELSSKTFIVIVIIIIIDVWNQLRVVELPIPSVLLAAMFQSWSAEIPVSCSS